MIEDSILCGDALAVLPTLAKGSVQTCVCSPPYWGLKDYRTRSWIGGDATCRHDHAVEEPHAWLGWDGELVPSLLCEACGSWFGQLGMEPTVERYIANLVRVFAEVHRVLKDDGTLWIDIGDGYNAYGNRGPSRSFSAHGDASRPTWTAGGLTCPAVANKSLIGLPWRLAQGLAEDPEHQWILRNEIVWAKQVAAPERVRDRFPRGHEYVLFLSKTERYFFNTNHGLGRVDTVWTIPPEPSRGGHPAPYPPALAGRCIRAGSKPGDLVLDPFAGSGTTLEVAALLGRRYIGIDVNEQYIPIMGERVRTALARAGERANFKEMMTIGDGK